MRRTYEVKIRLNQEEIQVLNCDVERSGLSREAYLRAVLKKRILKECPPVDYFEVLKNLRQINSNLNQIAVVANKKGFIDTAAYWENVKWLQRAVGEMMEVMYQ